MIKHSGHSTYRIFLLKENSKENFLKYWDKLEKIGCTYEQVNDKFYSVDVPKKYKYKSGLQIFRGRLK